MALSDTALRDTPGLKRRVYVGHLLHPGDAAFHVRDMPKILLVRDPVEFLKARRRQILRGAGGMLRHRVGLIDKTPLEQYEAILEGRGFESLWELYETRFKQWFDWEPRTHVLRYRDLDANPVGEMANLFDVLGWSVPRSEIALARPAFYSKRATWDPVPKDEEVPAEIVERLRERMDLWDILGYNPGKAVEDETARILEAGVGCDGGDDGGCGAERVVR